LETPENRERDQQLPLLKIILSGNHICRLWCSTFSSFPSTGCITCSTWLLYRWKEHIGHGAHNNKNSFVWNRHCISVQKQLRNTRLFWKKWSVIAGSYRRGRREPLQSVWIAILSYHDASHCKENDTTNMWFYYKELQSMYMSNWLYIYHRKAELWLNEVWSDFESCHRSAWILTVLLLPWCSSSILLCQDFPLIWFFTALYPHNSLFWGLQVLCRAHGVRGFITTFYHISCRQPTVTWCFLLVVADFRLFRCGFFCNIAELDQMHISNFLLQGQLYFSFLCLF